MKEILNSLLKFCTARIDIKNNGQNKNNIEILYNSDIHSSITTPEWFSDVEGIGTILHSSDCHLDLKIKCINKGTLHIWLRGIDFRDIKNNRFPIYIDFLKFKINDVDILKKNILVWHDNPYLYKKNVANEEIIRIHMEWKPFDNSSEYTPNELFINQNKQIEYLKEKLTLRENQIRSIPQLSNTTLGKSAFNGKIIYRNLFDINTRSLLDDFDGFCERLWFTYYLKHKFPNEDFKINIFGVSNSHDNITSPMNGKKVLWSGENLNYRYLEMKSKFNKYALDYVDFAMGFDFIDNPKYLRFPIWLTFHFSPFSTAEDIENIINQWNSISYEKTREVVAIASHDNWGVRSLIDKSINTLVDITYAGKWKNNSNELWENYDNKKRDYLKLFKYNLCAENIIDDAYVTEKIFDAISCDCIPLYAGGGNYLEPEVINQKAIIRWYEDEDINSDTIELFKNIISDEKTYNEFKDQDKVLETSAKFIINKFSELEKHFERLIYD